MLLFLLHAHLPQQPTYNRSPLDPAVSQYDWGGELDPLESTDSMMSDPLSSMMGDLDLDQHGSPATHPGGLGVYMGPRR